MKNLISVEHFKDEIEHCDKITEEIIATIYNIIDNLPAESEENIFKSIVEVKFSTLQVNENDVIIFKFPENMDETSLQYSMDAIRETFPGHQALGLCQNEDALVQSPKEAIDMLEKMIAKIKILEGAPTRKLIV